MNSSTKWLCLSVFQVHRLLRSFKKIYFDFVYISVLPANVSVYRVHEVPIEAIKEHQIPLEPELPLVVNWHVGTGIL